MKHARTLILAGALPALVGLPVLAQASDWVDIKDPKELRALYSNKTFRAPGWTGHYRADGTGVMIRESTNKPEPRTWAVKGNDRICVTSETGTTCYTYQYMSKQRDRVLATNVASGVSFMFFIEDGVPK